MKEKTEFKIGDTVILNEKGRRAVKNINPDTVFVVDSVSEDGTICSCFFRRIDLYSTEIEHYQTFTNSSQATKEQMLEELTKQMLETFKKKNADYGDSTTQTFKEFGLTSYTIRLNDKLNRIKSFCKKGELEVKDEKIIDTLMDMSAYCLLAAIDIKEQKGSDDKGTF
ncbi:hypothetical protein C7120_09130 [Prevotella sp. oral taxon 376]|uniref:nucleotide modification associated domain-containing protein n=1 Tax=Prevotella sp. oral taxon 376 TaxID=712466 RepID=UPI000D1D9F56|nr:nucleotide modification associated domain-containing protein [Prevotella sp. oral taxon 376]PTL34652.1 hypothetical protein C7120_09130 [Prevotella sp. oral taxon 376]